MYILTRAWAAPPRCSIVEFHSWFDTCWWACLFGKDSPMTPRFGNTKVFNERKLTFLCYGSCEDIPEELWGTPQSSLFTGNQLPQVFTVPGVVALNFTDFHIWYQLEIHLNRAWGDSLFNFWDFFYTIENNQTSNFRFLVKFCDRWVLQTFSKYFTTSFCFVWKMR